jgi:hypothetical protein
VFPARYELNSYIVFRKRLVSKRLNTVLQNSLSVSYITNSSVLRSSLFPFLGIRYNGYDSNRQFCNNLLTQFSQLIKQVRAANEITKQETISAASRLRPPYHMDRLTRHTSSYSDHMCALTADRTHGADACTLVYPGTADESGSLNFKQLNKGKHF